MTNLDDLVWRTSTQTGAGENCVEIAPTTHGVAIRDTKDHEHGPVIYLDHDQWAVFLDETSRNTPSTSDSGVIVTSRHLITRHDGTATHTTWHLRGLATGATLHFTIGEWAAFTSGVHNAEFDFPHPPPLVTT